jgi:class 3 adenylate cyclase
LARGAELHVVLPFDKEEFKTLSVATGKAQWLERFDASLARAHSVTFATEDRYLGHDQVFAYSSGVAMGLAVLRARFLDAHVLQIALWDGKPAGPVGTAADIAMWRQQGGESEIIDCPAETEGIDRAAPIEEASDTRSRELRAMLFGDVKGFSKLTESEVPAFVEHVLGAFGRVLAEHRPTVLYANTWGDGIFVVLPDALQAARCALDLQVAMHRLDLRSVGLPTTLALRLGGHFGPVFEAEDPVQNGKNFFGTHVSRIARIEPVTPPGEVYVTEPFAARLAIGPGARRASSSRVRRSASSFARRASSSRAKLSDSLVRFASLSSVCRPRGSRFARRALRFGLRSSVSSSRSRTSSVAPSM